MRTPLHKAIFAIAVFAAATIAACHKESTEKEEQETPAEPQPKTVTKANILGSYLVTKVEVAAAGKRSDMTEKWFSMYAGNCAKDDITTFKPDESFVVTDGTIECNETTADTGTWRVINATSLKLDSDTATIEEFNSTTLRIVNPVYSSPQNTMIFTYTRQ